MFYDAVGEHEEGRVVTPMWSADVAQTSRRGRGVQVLSVDSELPRCAQFSLDRCYRCSVQLKEDVLDVTASCQLFTCGKDDILYQS